MGAAAPQRREYGWLLVAERLPFFFLSVTFLYEEAIRSLTCFRLQLLISGVKTVFFFLWRYRGFVCNCTFSGYLDGPSSKMYEA
jgi:hypothetical protein